MNPNKSFPHGGMAVEDFQNLTEGRLIETVSLPHLAILPLVPYKGARLTFSVSKGQAIEEETVLARGAADVPLHSPIPGIVDEIRSVDLADGMVTQAAVIRLSGAFSRTGKPLTLREWRKEAPEKILARLYERGVIFTSSTLDTCFLPPRQPKVAQLVVNAVQPEPFVTVNYHLLVEFPEVMDEGLRILEKLYQPQKTHWAGDRRHQGLHERLVERGLLHGAEIHLVKEKYPQAQEKILYRTLFNQELRSDETPLGMDCLIVDPATLFAVYEAVAYDKPLVERFVALSGDCFKNPGVYRVRIGTPLAQLIRDAGGFIKEPVKILGGGPFRGRQLSSLATPITKETHAILALSSKDIHDSEELPCVRCGQCVAACPVGLQPIDILDPLDDDGPPRLPDAELCIECGLCAYVCPSHIPLLSLFEDAKKRARLPENTHAR